MPLRTPVAFVVGLVTMALLSALAFYASVTVFGAPDGGAAADFVRSRAGFVLLMLVPCLLLLSLEAACWMLVMRVRRGESTRDLAHEIRTRERLGLPPARLRTAASPAWRGLAMAAAVWLAVVAAVAATAYVIAPTRVSSNAAAAAYDPVSLAGRGAALATDAGYAADVELLSLAVERGLQTPTEREATLRGLLATPSNLYDALALIDPDGRVVATTDPAISDVHASAAFLVTRASGGIASSTIPPRPGEPGTLEFAAPVRSPDGSLVGVLLGRSSATRLWASALRGASGGHTVIVDGNGHFVAGVAPAALGRNWRATPAAPGELSVSLDGVPSVCAGRAIGQDTHLDMGWQLVSCVRASSAGAAVRLDPRSVVIAAVVAAVVVVLALIAVARRARKGVARHASPVGFEAIEARLRAHDEGAAP